MGTHILGISCVQSDKGILFGVQSDKGILCKVISVQSEILVGWLAILSMGNIL